MSRIHPAENRCHQGCRVEGKEGREEVYDLRYLHDRKYTSHDDDLDNQQYHCHHRHLFRHHDHHQQQQHQDGTGGDPSVLTVWKRSSMSFQGNDGFTVFDRQGRLVFRVDNYSRGTSRYYASTRSGLVLMDAVGNALLTLKPQLLSMQSQWNAYIGEHDGCAKKESRSRKVFYMRSPSLLFHSTNGCKRKAAEIFMGDKTQILPDFLIEGSFRARDCKITASSGALVAQTARKRFNNTTILLGDDVFSLVVQPGFDTTLTMAFLIILDRISYKPFTPALCS